RRILIVDDEQAMRDLLSSTLDVLPVEVLQASDGMEAMTLVETETFDLVITDYQLPACDGLEVCRQLKAVPTPRKPKTVLITAHGTLPFLLEAVNNGVVDAALPKPYQPSDLVQIVSRLLDLPISAMSR